MLLVIKMKNSKMNSVDNKLCGSAKAVLCPNCCQLGCLKPSPFLFFLVVHLHHKPLENYSSPSSYRLLVVIGYLASDSS